MLTASLLKPFTVIYEWRISLGSQLNCLSTQVLIYFY